MWNTNYMRDSQVQTTDCWCSEHVYQIQWIWFTNSYSSCRLYIHPEQIYPQELNDHPATLDTLNIRIIISTELNQRMNIGLTKCRARVSFKLYKLQPTLQPASELIQKLCKALVGKVTKTEPGNSPNNLTPRMVNK